MASNIQLICANCHQDKSALEQSAAHKGRPKPAEQLAKMRAWQVGVPKPQVTRERIRRSVLKTMADPALRAYLSAKAKERMPKGTGPWVGKHHTQATRDKISASLKARAESVVYELY